MMNVNIISAPSLECDVEASGSIPAFPFAPSIRVPPALTIPETPLRERRGFTEFVTIIPRPALAQGAAPMPAKGQLEPKAGGLPRRRRASSLKPVTTTIIRESRDFDFASTSSESSDEED